MTLVRTPVRITGTRMPTLYGRLVGHEATCYIDTVGESFMRDLLRLSVEARRLSSSAYVRVEHVSFEPLPLDAVTEHLLLDDTDRWEEARAALEARIKAHPMFKRLVGSHDGHPNAKPPTRRAARLARAICEDMGLDPRWYLGNVLGAAADAIRQGRLA